MRKHVAYCSVLAFALASCAGVEQQKNIMHLDAAGIPESYFETQVITGPCVASYEKVEDKNKQSGGILALALPFIEPAIKGIGKALQDAAAEKTATAQARGIWEEKELLECIQVVQGNFAVVGVHSSKPEIPSLELTADNKPGTLIGKPRFFAEFVNVAQQFGAKDLESQVGELWNEMDALKLSVEKKEKLASAISDVLGNKLKTPLNAAKFEEAKDSLVEAINAKYPKAAKSDRLQKFLDALATQMGKGYPFPKKDGLESEVGELCKAMDAEELSGEQKKNLASAIFDVLKIKINPDNFEKAKDSLVKEINKQYTHVTQDRRLEIFLDALANRMGTKYPFPPIQKEDLRLGFVYYGGDLNKDDTTWSFFESNTKKVTVEVKLTSMPGSDNTRTYSYNLGEINKGYYRQFLKELPKPNMTLKSKTLIEATITETKPKNETLAAVGDALTESSPKLAAAIADKLKENSSEAKEKLAAANDDTNTTYEKSLITAQRTFAAYCKAEESELLAKSAEAATAYVDAQATAKKAKKDSDSKLKLLKEVPVSASLDDRKNTCP
jgi:hypothetical protein